MALTPTTVAAARKTVPSRQALLESLRQIVTKYANEHMMAVNNRLVAALLDVSDPGLDARAVFQRVKSGNLLKNNSYAFFHVFCTALEQGLRREIDELVPAMKSARSAGPAALSLVPFAEMDNRVAFDAISRPFEMQYASQIATLNVRLGFLLERDILRIGQNPFRPEMFLTLIHQAWQEFEPDSEAHNLIVTLLRPQLLFDFAPMYDALCEALTSKGVQPGSVDSYNIRKTESAAAAKTARLKEKAALAKRLRQFLSDDDSAEQDVDTGIALIPDLPAMPSSGGGWRPSTAQGFAPAGQEAQAAGQQPAVQHASAAPAGGAAALMGQAQLLDMLKSMQARMPEQFARNPGASASVGAIPGADAGNVFYLPRLKETMPKGSLSRGDESTIDLLSKIFETVFVDPNIPSEIRDLIQFLQIPVLKAALVDKNFFFEEAHPARRMIDLLSRIGQERRQPNDPLFQAMQRSVSRVGRDFHEQVSVFSDAVAELEDSIRADETESATAIAAPIAVALKQEKVTAATRCAKTAVASRVGSGQVVALLETFLEKKWTSVLTVAYSVEEDKPGAVGNATKTMDELIWSVKPKITHEQRRALIAKLPGLLTALNQWLDVIHWQDADRLQFFAELAECHASIVRAPLDITPERQLEIAVEVAQEDAMRRLEKESAAAQVAEPEVDEAVLAIDGLGRGMWLEFVQSDASVRKVKLAWISPLRTLYIFSTGARQEAFSFSADKLVAAHRAGKVRVLQLDGVVGRALSEAMGQGAVNDSESRRAAG